MIHHQRPSMAKVKGSKLEQIIVVPYRPWRTFWVRAGMVLLLVLSAMTSFISGFDKGVQESGDASGERDQLRAEVATLQRSNGLLSESILSLEQASVVDEQALSSVQQTILALREQISQLEEDVLFYKQILSPENQEIGLVIGQLNLMQTENPAVIRYKLEIKQQGSNEEQISGYANVNVLGMQDAHEVSIPLRSLSDDVDSLDIRVQFRYFQNIEGTMQLPDNFEPQKIQILVVAEGANAKTVQKSFGWLVQN